MVVMLQEGESQTSRPFLSIGYKIYRGEDAQAQTTPKNVHQSKGNLLCCVQKLLKMLIQL